VRAITHYEVYAVKLGRWALHARLAGGEHDRALEMARTLEAETGRATQVIEENLDPESGSFHLQVLARNGEPPQDVKPPALQTDISSRIFMVGINAFGIGAITTMIMAVMLASMRDAAGGAYNMLLLFVFGASGLTAGLTLFKIYVPIELILWRNKGPEAQHRAIEALIFGTAGSDKGTPRAAAPSMTPPAPPPAPLFDAEPNAPPPPQMETNADQGEQTSFKIADTATADASPVTADAPTESLMDSAAAVMDSLLEKERGQLIAFTDAAIASLSAAKPQLQSFERFGLNLYIAGAAGAVAERAALSDTIKIDLLQKALEHAGTNATMATSFAERLDVSAQRPRFRRLIEAGHAAMTAQLDEKGLAGLPALIDLLAQWSDPTARAAETKTVTFLLTDIVGSTALTSKVGNSGAQRVVRAHNAIARAAVKNFRGGEVKHTGDGMLLTFPDPASAARAAIEIQQEATAYARDNPDAPLALRLGVHTGQASFEDGEYYGPALPVLNGVCSAAETDAIFVSEEVKAKSEGPAFRFTDMGKQVLKGSQAERQLYKLEWTPKPKVVKGPLEYRQIGTKPAGGAPAP